MTRLLPAAMKRAGVDAWVVVCRENDNDPLAPHVGGENAGAPAAFLFFRKRDWMKEAGSERVMWGTGHPVGYWAHDVGPSLSGAQREGLPYGASLRRLRPGQTFAFDGFFSWKLEGGDAKATKTISVEEMAVVTEKGAEYLIPPQEDLVLIPSAGK